MIDFIGNFKNAYRAVENLGLEPYENGDMSSAPAGSRNVKEILNLPVGCTVEFDERVIDVFGSQTMNPAFATRHNISRILIHEYRKIERRLGRPPTKVEIDRSTVLDSSYHILVFGSWAEFLRKLHG